MLPMTSAPQLFRSDRYCDSSVVIGVGDDGAVMTPEPGRDLVSVIDTLVEDVHFPRDLDPSHIAYRAVATNASDIAAMAARPRWMTLALTLDRADEAWLSRFAMGLFEAAEEYAVDLVGGDTTAGPGKVITIQLNGDVQPGRALTRCDARAGDRIFVSGTVGDAAAGLAKICKSPDLQRALEYRFQRPSARVALGQSLAGLATAAIDISDGLFADVSRLLDASGVGGVLEIQDLPLSDALRSLGDAAAEAYALSGGDDYELCFTVPEQRQRAIAELSEATGLRLSRIGEVIGGSGLSCTRNGKVVEFDHPGYRHFEGV